MNVCKKNVRKGKEEEVKCVSKGEEKRRLFHSSGLNGPQQQHETFSDRLVLPASPALLSQQIQVTSQAQNRRSSFI